MNKRVRFNIIWIFDNSQKGSWGDSDHSSQYDDVGGEVNIGEQKNEW